MDNNNNRGVFVEFFTATACKIYILEDFYKVMRSLEKGCLGVFVHIVIILFDVMLSEYL